MTARRTDGQTDVDSKVRSNEVRCAQKCRVVGINRHFRADVSSESYELENASCIGRNRAVTVIKIGYLTKSQKRN